MVTTTPPQTAQADTSQSGASQAQAGYAQDIELVLPECWEFNLEAYEELRAQNDNLILERTKQGRLRIVAAPGWESALTGGDMFADIVIWARENGGLAIPADAEIRLGPKSILLPDAGWADREQAAIYWSLSKKERGRPLPIVPALIVEVRSPGQSVPQQQRKMEEWMDNGVQLGWLVDPIGQNVFIYRAGQEPERLHRPEALSGEDVMEGFVMSCERLWR